MATYRVTAPDGGTYRIEGPDDATDAQIAQAVLARFPGSNRPPAPPDESKSGLIPSFKAGISNLKGDIAGLAGRAGAIDIGTAENYIAKQKEEANKVFEPTQEGWSESPWKKLKELAGGSAAYMLAPAAAGAAALALPASVAPAVATGIGMGLTGLVSGTQFAASNLGRQVEEGTPLAQTDLTAAALAAIPQAALDVLSLKMIPGVRGIFGAAGKKMTVEEAEAIATQGLKRTVADYTLATGKTMGVEGLTEAGQQVFERLQAGLNLTDEKAQKEYLENFIGGAALGGAMAPVGRYFERGREQREASVVGAMPGQRPGESLADAAQRLKNEIDAEKLNLLPPPAPPPPPVSPILSEQDLNNLPYGQIPAYIGTLQALPQTPEIRAAIKAANTASLNDTEGVVNDFLLKKLDEASRSLQPQADGAGDLSFLPADLSTVISAQLANSIGFVQNKSKTNIFDQIVGKDISDPDQAAAVIDILNKYKAGVKPGATSQNIDTFIESIPFFKPPATQGTVNVGTTDTAPGGESTVLASEPGAGSTTPGVAATQPDGMVSTGQDVTSTVGGEAAAPPPVITQSAKDLLESIDVGGGTPAFMTNKLKQIAADNGIEVLSSDTPNSVIDKIRDKVKPPAAKPEILEGGMNKSQWVDSLLGQNRIAKENFGITLDVTPNGKLIFNGDIRKTKQGKAFAASLEAAYKAGATEKEIVAAIQSAPSAPVKEFFSKRKPKVAPQPKAELSEVEKQDAEAIAAFKAEGPARIAEKTEQIKNIMGKILSRMGLKDVAVKIMDDIESKEAGGSYSAKLIKIALDEAKPVRTLRHEAIHALKELGFFSESQWNTLVKQAKERWIDTYLKSRDVNGEPLKEGEKSRYDIYMERPEFKSDPNAIIEEAIADAFGDFDTNGAPPGMLKAILNKLISFFDAIKSALQGNGIYTSEQAARQIFGKITRGELKAGETKAGETPSYSLRSPGKPATRENVVGAMEMAQEKQPYMNCQLCVQMATGVSKILELPKVNKAQIGDIYTFNERKNMASHYAVDVGSGNVAEVEEWGEQVRVVPLSKVVDEYDKPSAIRRAPETAYTREKFSLAVPKPLADRGITQEHIDLYKDWSAKQHWVEKDTEFATRSEKIVATKAKNKFFNAIEKLGKWEEYYPTIANFVDLQKLPKEKLSLSELKATAREGSITSGAQSGVQSGAQQGEASEQARSGEPALRPGDRSGEGSDGRDEEKLSIRKAGDSGGVGRGREAVVSAAPLQGSPSVPSVNGPDPRIVEVAERYAREHGIDLKRQSEYVEVSWPRGKRLADAYEAMQHNPQDPAVKAAYKDLIKQTTAQYLALEKAGYKFWFIDFAIPSNEAYINTPWNSIRDLRNNKEMGVFPTTSGFGSSDLDVADNPLLVDTGIKWPNGGVDGELKNVLANDLFRAVHDAFGHGIEGAGFRWDGEENAWQAHARLYTGPALHALTSETRGQNSQVNFGKDGEFNRTASGADTIFADQKVGLMPDWTWKEGMSKDEPVFQELDSRKDAKMFRNAVDRVKRGREYAFPLHVHDLETYQDARLFLSEDKESGFALIGDEIGSFFSGGGGQAYPTLRLAVEEGGRRIDAYRTKLPSVLGKANFRPVARVEFNPEMATELWDFEKFKQFQNGNPDLVFYAYDPSFNPKGDLKAGDEAVAKTPLVEYEQAVELQVAAAKYSLRGITLGTKQQDSVASSGVHYGKAKTDTLDALKYGTGLRGAESRRLETHWDNRIKKRVYFYIAKPDGTMPLPESGLGGYVYTQTFDNLAPPSVVSRLYSEARGDANTMESLIVDAGYDGYAVPKMGMMVVLNHNTPVEYQGTKAEYESKKQEKLSLRSIPLSTRGIMEANDAFARSELGLKTKAVRNRFNKVRDIAIALNRETLENQGQMNRKELTTDDLNTISRALADEVSYQLLSSSKTGTGLGWYSNNYPKAVKKLAKRFPELETNQHARAVFSALVAVTSNGEKVTKNISNAITLYAKLRDGKPLVAMSNRRATALVNNLKQIEMLLIKYDTDFEKELKKEVTVADMNAYLRSVGKKADASYLANTRIPAAAIYFGPKLGAFYANLSGSEGYLTMDLWWNRTFNRMRGLLIPHATDASIDKFREMIGKPNATRDDILAEAVPLRDKYKQYSFNTELEHLVGKKEPDTKAGKIDWVKRARVVAEDAFDQLMYDNRLEKMANTIYKNEYEMLQEAPFSSSDRKFMYDAARRTQKLLQEEKINLSLADIQAALWYYEKRLYGKLSGKKADDIGYEEAIIKQSSEGRGRTRLSVVFDRGVNTGNVAAGESGTPDEVGRVPSGSTEKLSLRAPDTKEFKQFFDDSKVVDENGEPLVVYHYSPKSNGLFNEFDKKRITSNDQDAPYNGFWFSGKPEEDMPHGTVRAFYISLKNPASAEQGYRVARKIENNYDLNPKYKAANSLQDAVRIELVSQGFDGIIHYTPEEAQGTGGTWIVFEPNQIKSATGNIGTYDKKNPDIRYSLRSTWRASANAAIDRTSVARIEEGWASRILNAISPKHFSEYRQVWLNRYNQLGVYDKQRADRMGGFGLLADASSEAAAMMSDYGAGLTAAVFSKAGGVPVFANGMTTISTLNGTVKGPLEIFSVLTKLGKGDPDIYRAYQLWAGVKRGKRFMPSTTNPNGTEENYLPSDIAEAAYYEKLYPEFVDVQKEWIKYNNPLSKYLVDTGVISAEGRKEWIKYADYIPFYRQVDDEQTVGPKLFQSLTGVKPPKKLKGGTDLPIADFLETIIRNTQSAIQMGIKNTAGQKAVTVALSLNTPGSTDVLEPLAYTSTTDDSITILVNGMKKSFRSQDKLWLQAVTSLNLPDVPFMGLFSKPAQLLRTLVTKEPGFMLANMIRDSMSSYVTSGVSSVNPATTLNNFAAAIAGKSPEFQALFNAGILGGHEYSKDIIQSGNKFASDLRKTSGFRTANEKLASPITGIWEALEKGTTASDAATRMQVYKEVLAKTNNEAEAIYRAVEVMNFNRKGNSAIVRVLTAAIPFLNARIQGMDVFYRAAFGKNTNQLTAEAIQKQFFIRGATMMAMSCMYWALTHDDDDYKKQEQETKDNYWLLPSLGIKLPIPFEVGILFKVVPERIMALTFGTDTHKDFTESMVRQLSNTLSLNPIPQVAKPFIEYNTNYNFFTGRPIVGSGMEGVESGYQTGPNTSGIAADIGKATGMSPLKLDHLIGGFTGTMGMYAFSLMDSIYKINGDSTDASKRFEQSPVIKRFLIDPEARGTVSAYYEIKNSTDAAVRTAGLLERTMNYKEWGPYYKDNIKLLATHDYMLSLEKSMKDFREMKLMIRSSKLSPDEKRDALLNITKAENKLTSNIQVIKKNID